MTRNPQAAAIAATALLLLIFVIAPMLANVTAALNAGGAA